MNESPISFRIIPASEIHSILPLLKMLSKKTPSEAILKTRLTEMAQQNYECVGIYLDSVLIGCCGLWFQTRHYAGRSIEMDHVVVTDEHRNSGIGKKLMNYVYEYAKKHDCNWVELNTYVDNFLSHKFYYSHGFVAKGYHFIKDITQTT
ncbi:GNAT family N-acetyltransferase [Candidatus Ulvibacter alkanivorans]|uniref:GNAT family N-acetyltransferase n=1 Tax=Candidatus Ulvibacter alkanivorans TaxID=2267620 RepID=UPI001FE4BEFB|nr:GNAT family N-acetyltransferase [Candidatus Ulvibacter alkanivorans]